MKRVLLASSALMLLAGATAASAASSCHGDFLSIDGGWIAYPRCQREAAEAVAAAYGQHIVRNPIEAREVSRAEFCNGNNDIRTTAYCAPFKD